MTFSFTAFTRATLARSEAVNAVFNAIKAYTDSLPAVSKIIAGTVTYAADSGAADAYVVTLNPAPLAYSEGMTVDFKATNANTGASTINVNSLGVKAIRAYDGAVLVAGQIPAGGIVTARYDGSVFRLNNIVGVSVPDDDTVTNAKLADMAQATIKGRASGAGTGDPTDLSGAQVSAILSAASDSAQGAVELATTGEATTGTDTARAVTPAGLLAGLRGNLLGTVSESSGDPTGAVIERGSNANGKYVRFADGTQICTLTQTGVSVAITTATGQLFRDNGTLATWTFPAEFAAAPVCIITPLSTFIWGGMISATTTAATRNLLAAVSYNSTLAITNVAIGRWF